MTTSLKTAMDDHGKFLTKKQFALAIGMSVRHVSRLMETEKVKPAKWIGVHPYFHPADAIAFLNGSESRPQVEEDAKKRGDFGQCSETTERGRSE